MPLVLDISTVQHLRVGVWRIDESQRFFMDGLPLSDTERDLVSSFNPPKRLEWLASRYVLDHITDHEERLETATKPTGKPYLISGAHEISLSHSDEYVAAMIGPTDVGVDIQRCKEKIVRLEQKFATAEESARIDRARTIPHLHILWGAKEALYKIYARKQLNFLKHLSVDLPGDPNTHESFAGNIHIDNNVISCALYSRILGNYVLVYGHKLS